MDYIDFLKDQCPPAIVEYVVGKNMTLGTTEPWPNNDYVGTNVSDPCHVAALLYRSSILTANVVPQIADYIVRDTGEYFDTVQDQDRPVLVAVMRQMAERDQLPQRFFPTVTRHRIDVRDALVKRFPSLPAPENATPEANVEAFAYLRYLTAMGDLDVLPMFIETLRLEPNPGFVTSHLGQLRRLEMQQQEAIYKAFINDTRQSLTATQMPGLVVANIARRALGLPNHEGPFQLVDNRGQPVRP